MRENPLSVRIDEERNFLIWRSVAGYTASWKSRKGGVAVRKMRMHYLDAFSLRVLEEIDVGGSVDSTGVGIWTLLRTKP